MNERDKAKSYVLKLLAKRYKTEFEIRNILKGRFGLSDEEVDEIIREVKDLGLISDDYFAKSFVESRVNKGYGRRYIVTRLKAKGVDFNEEFSPNIEKVIEVVRRKYGKELETENKFERKKVFGKIFNFLSYRGFSSDEIKEIIKRL